MDSLTVIILMVIIFMLVSVQKRVKHLEQKLSRLEGGSKQPSQKTPPNKGPWQISEPTKENATQPVAAQTLDDIPASAPSPEPEPTPTTATEADTGEVETPPSENDAASPWQVRAQKSEQINNSTNSLNAIETDLSTRWLIWLGGITLALGGIFVVKYSIDEGLLSPAVRVSLGFILGVILAGAGEWLRRARSDLSFMKDTPDYLPSAVAAAGFAITFAAIYAAFGLYHLIPALIALVGMAAVSLTATYMALNQGRFFAFLGLIGGMGAPALVSTGNGNAWALFPYIMVIAAAALWIAREKQWVNLAATAVLMALGWSVIWLFGPYKTGDILPISLFLMALSYVNMTMLSGASEKRLNDPKLTGLSPSHPITQLSDVASVGIVLTLIGTIRLEHYSTTALVIAAIALALQAFAVRKSPENDLSGIASVGGVLFLLATWHVPDILQLKMAAATKGASFAPWSPIDIPGLEKFLGTALISSLFISGLTFWQLPQLLRKGLWSSLGAAFPLLALSVVYWRVKDLETSIEFAATALVLALLATAAVTLMAKRDKALYTTAVAAYATAASTAVALALAMTLRDAWLSFALALEIVAIAAIWRTTHVQALRHVALLFTAIVLVRLFLNASIFNYGSPSMHVVFNWLLYGYLLTAALLYVAARIFEDKDQNGKLVPVLKAGCGLLLIGYATLETRVLFSESHSLTGEPTALEMAIHALNWTASSTLLMWREIKDKMYLFKVMRRMMTMVSLLALVVFGGLVGLFERKEISDTLIFNLQFLLLFMPSVLYGLKAWMAHKAGYALSEKLYGGVAFLGIWAWASFEVYNAFHPNALKSSLNTTWEMYSYSAVWLVYALMLLIVGLKLGSQRIRTAGLGVLGIVILKVFIFDMSNLEGLARASSFIGLGLSLIGISYLYQRIKNKPQPSPVE